MKIKSLLCSLGLVGLAGLPAQAATVETPGFLKFDSWFSTLRDENLIGSTVDVLSMDPKFPNTPDMISYAAGLTTRGVFPDDSHAEYGARLSGWITPSVTGDYNFYLASDDASQLFVSTDATEANLMMVAWEAFCCHGFQEPGNDTTTVSPLHMVAGQKYAIQVLLKEEAGGDYVQVAMQDANGTLPAASLVPLSSTMLSSMADTTGASLAITQQPVTTTTPENAPSVNFSIAVTALTAFGKYTNPTEFTNVQGGPLQLGTKAQLDTFYQWFTNGVEVPGAHSTNFTIAWPKKAQNGMKVKCYTAVPGIPLYSSEVTLNVSADTTPPTIVNAKADSSFADVEVRFSEPVADTALQASHYALDQGVTVSSVDRVDLMTLKLNTSKMADGKTYTLTINGVQDTATPPNSIAANTQIQFKSFVFVPGVVLHQKYNGVDDNTGNNIANLFSDARFPNQPDRKDLAVRFEYPANAVGRDANADPDRDYFDTLDGYFIAPTSGNYIFFISFADRCWLYLSTDESPANQHLIVAQQGWSDPRNWLTSHDYPVDQARSDTYASSQWPAGNTITLEAGHRYYTLLVHHDPSWSGGDWFAATYKEDTDSDPPNGSAPRLTGGAVGSYLDPTIGSVTFSLQPTNVTALAGNKAMFAALASGTSEYTTNLTYQWQSAPKGSSTWTDIAGATAPIYTTPFLVAADDGKQFRVVATVAPVSLISAVSTLTVTVDTTPPTVVKASTDMTWTDVLITFSEPVTDTALVATHYQIDQGITVSAVSRVDPLTVRLTTSKLTEGKVYLMTLSGIQDTATPPNSIAANTQVEVRALLFVTGAALHKKYSNFDNGTGGDPVNLFSDPRFSNNPDRQDMEQRWEYPPAGNYRDSNVDPVRNYFDTIEGYFIAPATTNYVFYSCGADRWWLYLSTDESPANKHLIAAQPAGWTNPRDWMLGQGGTDMTVARSDQFTGTEWPNGNTISLLSGKRYYLLSVHHDPSWSGADDFAVTYEFEGESDPNNGDAPKLTGNLIGYYFDPSGASVTFTTQPQDKTVVQARDTTFTVAATGSSVYGNTVFFQWQSAPKGTSTWTDIPGATATVYKTPLLTLADDGTQFRVVASVAPYSKVSSVATLTVLRDTFPPLVSVGAMVDDTPGVVDVGIGFDETVDSAVNVLANYSVSPGTITGISVFTNRFTANSQNPLAMLLKQSVLLKVTGLSSSGTVTVRNVGDTYGNKITSTNVSFVVDTKMKWGVVGANEFGGWNAVTPVAANGWDMYCDGVGAWGTYDEAALVYEQVSGNFDKKLRVAYQDGSSTWARAGLIAKEQLSFGVDRATQTNNASRYQMCLVSPLGAVLTGPGDAGYALWSLNRRLDTGGATDSPNPNINSVPAYPNAWCRIQRVGQTFTMFRSDDGVNWINIGSTTWGVDDASKKAMPDTLYVGPDYAPEIGNITQAGDQGTFLAQIRDYGDYSANLTPLQVRLEVNGKVIITWSAGTLVASPTVSGTYNPVTGAISPYSVTPAAGTSMFYRLLQ